MKKSRLYRIIRVKTLRHFHWLSIQWAEMYEWNQKHGYW